MKRNPLGAFIATVVAILLVVVLAFLIAAWIRSEEAPGFIPEQVTEEALTR